LGDIFSYIHKALSRGKVPKDIKDSKNKHQKG